MGETVAYLNAESHFQQCWWEGLSPRFMQKYGKELGPGARSSAEWKLADWNLIVEDLLLSPGKGWFQIFQPEYAKYSARLSEL